ncbi:PAS domain-containing protein [Pelagibius sp.]|uniref:PAS domain-containing protein n=1 Tax=Pelagibius sp. TaxID=1931238 RepID=UPI003B513590
MESESVQALADRIVRHLTAPGTAAQSGRDAALALQVDIEDLRLKLDPGEDDLPTEMLRQVLRYWRSLPRVGGIPDRIKVEPEDLRPALGYLMLIDVLTGPGIGPGDFRYALYGTKIAEVSGFDMTGKSVWEVATTGAIQRFFAACYEAAVTLRKPLLTVHQAPPSITVSHWHRLILPLGCEGEVRRFLVCNVPMHDDGAGEELVVTSPPIPVAKPPAEHD